MDRFSRCGETTHLIFLSVVFSATKGFYNMSHRFVIFPRPAHFLSTRPRFFIDGHNTQLNCIKEKWHRRRHLYQISGSGKVIWHILPCILPSSTSLDLIPSCMGLFHLLQMFPRRSSLSIHITRFHHCQQPIFSSSL